MSKIAQIQRASIGKGFRALALRGSDIAESIDPFLGVDHAWMSVPTFPPHPHAGFSAVSYLFLDSETDIASRDSSGAKNAIQPGGLQWTTAGRGIVHEEIPAVTGKTVHMLQIFVNLPVERQNDEPYSLKIEPEEVPIVRLPGGEVRVALGSFGDARSPLNPPTEVCLLEISLDEGGELALPVSAEFSAFILPVSGTLEVDGKPFEGNGPQAPLFPAEAAPREIWLRAKQGAVTAMFFSGRPLRQPVFWQGPMASASLEALAARTAAYQRGEFGTV